MKITERAVRAALRLLGRSPTAMAVSLRRRRIKGLINDPQDCPLAYYLTKAFGARVWVNPCRIIVGGDVSITPSAEASTFVENFDNNQYPFLEAK